MGLQVRAVVSFSHERDGEAREELSDPDCPARLAELSIVRVRLMRLQRKCAVPAVGTKLVRSNRGANPEGATRLFDFRLK